MKVNLTKQWHTIRSPQNAIARNPKPSTATWHNLILKCMPVLVYQNQCGERNEWFGSVNMDYKFVRSGPTRKSKQKAQRDAEKLAIELLLDIRDATKELMIQFGISEDD